MESKSLNLRLQVWRQPSTQASGKFETYELPSVPVHASFLEMLDLLNEQLITEGREPVAFDHDCREGICGMCSLYINGRAHGPQQGTTTCQLHMRHFKDGETITIEPFRAKAFPVVRDLVVNRSAFDRIQQAGGYITVNTGNAPDGNAVPIPKTDADEAFAAAACIGCGPAKMPRRCYLYPPRFLSMPCCLKGNPSIAKGFFRWWRPWMRKVLGIAPTPGHAKQNAPKEFRWRTLLA
jgi:succinate dehydrogenase / fumarate reductase iron-sulfur subunit